MGSIREQIQALATQVPSEFQGVVFQMGKMAGNSKAELEQNMPIMGSLFNNVLNSASGVAESEKAAQDKDEGAGIIEAGLKEVVDNDRGLFKLRGSSLGNFWAKALKNDPVLKASYVAVGKSHALQEKFRARWTVQTYQSVRSQRLRTTWITQKDNKFGKYMSFSKFVQEEGGGPDDLLASVKCLIKYIGYHKAGKLYNNKRPYIQWNDDKDRFEMIRIDSAFDDSLEDSWVMRKREFGFVSEGSSPQCQPPRDVRVSETAKPGAAKKKAKLGTEQNDQRPEVKAEPKDEVREDPKEAAKGLKKELEAKVKRVKVIKDKARIATSIANDIVNSVKTKARWQYAAGCDQVQDLERAMAELEKFKTANPFWNDIMLKDKSESVKKRHVNARVHLNFDLQHIFEGLCADLIRECRTVKSMHDAKIGVQSS
jgi:hypothetical protein